MKNNLLIIIIYLFFTKFLHAENLNIKAKSISIDKANQISIFKDEVVIKDQENNVIKTNYAEYDKKSKFFLIKNGFQVIDKLGNYYEGLNATYDENNKIFIGKGPTSISTIEGYQVKTEGILIDYNKNIVRSENSTVIVDSQKNSISMQNFEYEKNNNIFKSLGFIKVVDKMKNSYEFSQLYLNEKTKEIIGTDAKAFFNQENFKDHPQNKPRIFSNTMSLNKNESQFLKSKFTMCNYRENDKCPPWELSASKLKHNKTKKTIYYDNAVVRVYNIPIFYFPKLAHPDPTVDRRSGFLNPSYTDTKNLGTSLKLPYFWAISDDKDLTINNRLFASENPLFVGEYRQALKNSDLIFNFGYTDGYNKTSATKKGGNKSHFFSKFTKKFETNENVDSNLELNLQHVSNKKYLKLYRIDSNLVNYSTDTLENDIMYNYYNDEQNFLFQSKASAFRTLKDKYNDKYEYIIPDLSFKKSLFNKNGYGNFQSNLKVQNYETNKYKKTLINNFDWSFKTKQFSWFKGNFLTNIKNVNYDHQNIDNYKPDTVNEVFGSVGYLASVDLFKSERNNVKEFLSPKLLLRYAPNHMKKDSSADFNLSEKNIFSLDRLQSSDNYESGTNISLGLDYQKKYEEKNYNFSIAQIINEKKTNKKMPASSSLDKRFSDIVGSFNYDTKGFKLDYNFIIDQNYKEINYNEISSAYDINNIKFNLNYLKEDNSSGENEYFKSSINIKKGDNGLFSLSNKRNLVTNSSEFYDLSYEYINDCLRAGIVFRREFYNDSELESENSLMFKITLNSFGSINSPSFSQ